jgi:hypothetical protein
MHGSSIVARTGSLEIRKAACSSSVFAQIGSGRLMETVVVVGSCAVSMSERLD